MPLQIQGARPYPRVSRQRGATGKHSPAALAVGYTIEENTEGTGDLYEAICSDDPSPGCILAICDRYIGAWIDEVPPPSYEEIEEVHCFGNCGIGEALDFERFDVLFFRIRNARKDPLIQISPSVQGIPSSRPTGRVTLADEAAPGLPPAVSGVTCIYDPESPLGENESSPILFRRYFPEEIDGTERLNAIGGRAIVRFQSDGCTEPQTGYSFLDAGELVDAGLILSSRPMGALRDSISRFGVAEDQDVSVRLSFAPDEALDNVFAVRLYHSQPQGMPLDAIQLVAASPGACNGGTRPCYEDLDWFVSVRQRSWLANPSRRAIDSA